MSTVKKKSASNLAGNDAQESFLARPYIDPYYESHNVMSDIDAPIIGGQYRVTNFNPARGPVLGSKDVENKKRERTGEAASADQKPADEIGWLEWLFGSDEKTKQEVIEEKTDLKATENERLGLYVIGGIFVIYVGSRFFNLRS